MAIDPRTVAIGGGASFGYFTSGGLQDDPLDTVINTGIGAATGAFLKIPEFDLKQMSKVAIGPSISIDEILNRKTIKQNILENNREDSLKFINRNISDRDKLPEWILKKQKTIENTKADTRAKLDKINKYASDENTKIADRRIKAEEAWNNKLAFTDNKVSAHMQYLDKQVSRLEKLIPTAEANFQNRQAAHFDRSIRQGFLAYKPNKNIYLWNRDNYSGDNPKFKVNKIIGNSNISPEIDKYLDSLPKDRYNSIRSDSSKLATQRMEANPKYYREKAEQRVRDRIKEYTERTRELYKDFDLYGLTLNNRVQAEKIDLKDIPSIEQRVIVKDSNGVFVAETTYNSSEYKALRRESKINSKDSSNKDRLKWTKQNLGNNPRKLSFDFQVKLEDEWITQKEFLHRQNILLRDFNYFSEYLDNVTNSWDGFEKAVDRSLKATYNRMTEGFMHYNIAPEYVRSLGLDSPGTTGNLQAYLAGQSIYQAQSKHKSLTVQNLQDQIAQLKDPTFREQEEARIRQVWAEDQKKIEEIYKPIRDKALNELDHKERLIKSGRQISIQELGRKYDETVSAADLKIEQWNSYIDKNDTQFLNIQNYLKSKGILVPDRESLKEFIETTDKHDLLQDISRIAKGSDILDLRNVKANNLDSVIALSVDNNERTISQYLQRSLGHSKELADEKAAMIHKRASGPDVDFVNGTVKFKDKANGKDVTLPLTSYGTAEDGSKIRFHSRGAGTYNTVTPFNPFGKHLIDTQARFNNNGVVQHLGEDIAALTKQYDPEMMLKFLPDNVPISSILDNIRSLFHYDSTESNASQMVIGENFNPSSPMFKNSQGLVNYGFTLNTDDKGVINPTKPFKKLQTIASGEETAESSRLMAELNDKLGYQAAHIHDNVSSNALTVAQLKGYTGLAAFSPTERGTSTVGNRGYGLNQLNENTERLRRLIGNERFNREFSTSQALTKLDVSNADLFNKISTGILGDNSIVLADGAGLFNLKEHRDFTIKDGATIKIPLKEAAITHPELKKALQADNTSEYLNKNPITIGSESLGKSGDKDIALNRMYSSGVIRGADITDGNLLLRVDAEFDPKQQRHSKLFSVGTKSLNTGIEQDNFDILTTLGQKINDGSIVDTGNGYKYNGNILSLEDIGTALRNEIKAQKSAGTFKSFHMISNAEDTGMEEVIKSLNQGHLKGNTVYDKLATQGKSGADAVLTALLFTEQKAATDLTAMLGITLQEKLEKQYQEAFDYLSQSGNKHLNSSDKVIQDLKSSGFLSDDTSLLDNAHLQAQKRAFQTQFSNIFGSGQLTKSRNQDAHLHAAFEMVRRSGISESLSKGEAIAIGSFNKGQSIVGVGNPAKISWVAASQLRASGLSKEQLEMFGTTNKDLLYEVRSTISENRRATDSTINQAIFGKEARFQHMINSAMIAENRNEIFELEFGHHPNVANNPYLTYNLTFDDHEVKSINFSKITTTRSGKYQNEEGLNLLKTLEKKKLEVLSADILFREATDSESRKAAKVKLVETLDDYLQHSRKMYSGTNSLSKAVLALESKASSIMQVKGIGGYAEKYAIEQFDPKTSTTGKRRHLWFISEEEALYKAKQLGKTENDIIFEEIVDGNGNKLLQPKYKGEDGKLIPLASLLTREPAQGPLSSDLIEWIVDPTLKGEYHRNQAYVANANSIYKRAMFGDMDQDTVQTLLGNFKNNSDFEAIDNIKQEARNTFAEMEGLLKDIAVKGNKNKPNKTLLDFKDEEEYALYRAAGGIKGRTRKQLSAPATGLAVAYSKALEIELGQEGDNVRFLKGRMVTHQLIENLIKSAHLDTDKFVSAQKHAVDELTFARRAFIGKDNSVRYTSEEYEKALRQHLPAFLNMENLKEGSASKVQASSILEDIIQSELKHGHSVGNNPFNPMDLNEHRYKTTFTDSLTNMLKESGYIDMDFASFSERPRTSSGQVVTGMSDIVKDIYKNNKSVLFGGLGAMAGLAMLGRSSPSFSDSRENLQEHSSNQMMSTKTNSANSINDTPMGINTNNLKSNFITPKVFNNKGIKVDGDFLPNAMVDGYEAYNEFSSMLDTDNIQEQAYNITNAAFGNGLRSARLQTN